jgi:hypothetical protein
MNSRKGSETADKRAHHDWGSFLIAKYERSHWRNQTESGAQPHFHKLAGLNDTENLCPAGRLRPGVVGLSYAYFQSLGLPSFLNE